jgi:hypothetical protein
MVICSFYRFLGVRGLFLRGTASSVMSLDPLSESISEVLKRIIPWLEGEPPTAEPELPRGANDNAPTRKLLAATCKDATRSCCGH